ncbi:MFS transporter [Gordonia otitidis]|uniref:Major facilitator superfamily transporter n=1 Tax=Gordonia otitidis (strain DSM 44809 / CCUG 52243 / JCM 12355 / NBRC 100426 / IFM 10032) TaxID=1108044 RepID=H5TUI8_GORO1|nr:MFS transporter [Gordonia otitidis]UEA59950.1 MFS transporter [Gordonia otitidis]GAB37146.1 putative major facilitator superfamily transporter [Gordonia otitidis NBRC 100426]
MKQIPRGIWVLLSANVVIALGFGLIAPALPTFARSFDVGYTAVSAVVSAFAVMRLIFAPATGRLVTILGERRIYLTGLLIVAASTLACAFAQNYIQLLLFRGAGGIGSTMFTVSAMALLIRLSPNEIRGRVSGFFSAGFLIGNITGPLIGSALVGFGLRMPFVVYAIALLVASAVVATQLRDTAEPVTSDAPQRSAMSLRAALRDSAYRAIIASNFTQGWASMGVRVAVVPLFITEGLDQSAAMTGVVLAVYAAGNVAAILVAGRMSDRLGRRPVMLPGLAIMAISTALLGFSPNIVAALVLSLFAGVGSGLFAPTHQAALADVLGARRQGGSALAAYSMSSDLGAVTGPIVVGFVAGSVGFGPAFVLTGAVAAVAFVAWLFARETAPEVVGEAPRLHPTDQAEPDSP